MDISGKQYVTSSVRITKNKVVLNTDLTGISRISKTIEIFLRHGFTMYPRLA
jgi:hypothetical protein